MNTIHLDLLGSQTRFLGKKYRTRVVEAGEGEALILMHGGGGHAEAYSRNIVRLGEHFRTMAIDFIWHGLSAKPRFANGNWLAQFSDQIIDLMDAEGIEKAHLGGESLGGWICFDMAINHPQRVGKIVLNTSWGQKFKPGTVKEATAGLDRVARSITGRVGESRPRGDPQAIGVVDVVA